ncbi:MAG: hypothetical protein CMJ42_05110 [Phyllobacteriaceae bacterium]|nr:hypothetical protein [Phyllobacteriaceae bacterium]MBA91199.1 hypothetical protein [Phyllobacteriaceae bacterium]
MSRLTDLLGRKKPKAEIPAYVTADNSQLHRRMNSILSRPTRKDLNPPQLTRDDYTHAGYSEPPLAEIVTDENAWQQDVVQDAARARQPDTGIAETPREHEIGAETPAPVATTRNSAPQVMDRDQPQMAEAAQLVADHANGDGADSGNANDELDKLRERLKARLEALTGETGPNPDAAQEEDPIEIESGSLRPEEHMTSGEEVSVVPGEENETLAYSRAPVSAPPLMPETDGLLVAHEKPVHPAGDKGVLEPETASGSTSCNHGDVTAINRLPLPASLAETNDGAEAAGLAVKVADYLMFEAGYYPEELPTAAVSVWCMDYLMRNLSEGGLGAFVYNAWGQPDLWTACADGLKGCGAVNHLNALEALSDLVARDSGLAEALAEAPEAGQGNADLAAIEDELTEAENRAPLLERAGRWLLDQETVEFIDDEAFQDAVSSLGEKPGLEQRRQAAA